jgi:hypothetical protein
MLALFSLDRIEFWQNHENREENQRLSIIIIEPLLSSSSQLVIIIIVITRALQSMPYLVSCIIQDTSCPYNYLASPLPCSYLNHKRHAGARKAARKSARSSMNAMQKLKGTRYPSPHEVKYPVPESKLEWARSFRNAPPPRTIKTPSVIHTQF